MSTESGLRGEADAASAADLSVARASQNHTLLESVANRLADADGVTILSHIRPDADSIGSGLALKIALERLGVEVEFGIPGRWEVPAAVAELPRASTIVRSTDLAGYSHVVAVDCASLDRLGECRTLFQDAAYSAVVDHHATNPGFGTVSIIDDNADCSTEIVLDLIDILGIPIDVEIATCVYAGLVTDTESFRSARPRSFEIAARLLDIGIDGQAIAHRLLDRRPFAWLRLVAEVLGGAQLLRGLQENVSLVYAVVTQGASSEVGWEDTETIIDIIRTVGDADIAAVFKEVSSGHWNVSLRSHAITDVASVATGFDGGGHRRKAGYIDAGSQQEVVDRLVRRLSK